MPLAFCATITDCGEYTARGVVRAKEDGLKLIVNEKTQSEYVISMDPLAQGQLSGLIDRDALVKLVLDKKLDGQKATISKIISAKARIPDPLNPEDSGFTLDKKIPCKL